VEGIIAFPYDTKEGLFAFPYYCFPTQRPERILPGL